MSKSKRGNKDRNYERRLEKKAMRSIREIDEKRLSRAMNRNERSERYDSDSWDIDYDRE